jgi:hypothetical protein
MNTLPNRVLVGVVGAIVVLAGVVAVVARTRSPMSVTSGSPEAVVQHYVTAVLARHHDSAAAYFDPDGSCDAADLDAQNYVARNARVELVDSTVRGDAGRVVVRITTPSGGPFPNFLDEEVTFRLARAGASWVLTGSPWPMYGCDEGRVK